MRESIEMSQEQMLGRFSAEREQMLKVIRSIGNEPLLYDRGRREKGKEGKKRWRGQIFKAMYLSRRRAAPSLFVKGMGVGRFSSQKRSKCSKVLKDKVEQS